MKIGVIGLGLIGGSLVRAIKKNISDATIVAFDKNIEDLKNAFNDGNINKFCTEIDTEFKDCNVIFICTPVNVSINIVKILKDIVDKECIITDVGSTKEEIYNNIKYIGDINFIGGHPMAGSEKTGYLNSSDILFENALYIITPDDNTCEKDILLLKGIVEKIGALCIVLSPQEHDKYVSIISHIPHILASSLVNFVKYNDDERETLRTLAAGGFKDITRIASSDGALWQSIISSNKKFVLENFKSFINELQFIYNVIEKEEDSSVLINYINDGKNYRNKFKNVSSYFKFYDIVVDVKDEPNTIAEVATLLGKNNINIKNIGINNNREDTLFALSISFNDEKSMLSAIDVLDKNKYQTKKL